MGQYRGPDGTIYEDAPGGGYRIVGPPQAVTVPLGPRDPSKVRSEQREDERLQMSRESAQREREKYERENTMVPPPGDTSKTGDEYLATLPTSLAGQVKALAEGRRAFPTGSALRSPSVQELIAAATQYDPTLDAANAATRVKTRANFTSGKARQNMTAINTALGHLGTLWDRAQKLENRSLPVWNAIANKYETETGDKRVKDFNFAKQAVVDEMTRVFKGSGGNLTEVLEWQKQLSSSSSPEQLRGVVGTAVELLHSRLEALGQEYSGGMGRSADPVEFLTPHSQKVFNALGPGGDGNVGDPPKNDGPPPILGGDGSAPSPPSGPPPVGGKADYSGMVGGPDAGLAQGAYRNVYDPASAAGLAALIRKGAPYKRAAAYASSRGFMPPSEKEYGSAVSYQRGHPNAQPNVEASKSVPTTAWQRFSASPGASAITEGGAAATAGLTDLAGRTIAGDTWDANRQALAATNPKSALAGNVIGGLAGMIGGGNIAGNLLRAGARGGLGRNALALAARNPVKAGILGDVGYGAAYGANESPDDPLGGAATGGVAGLAGSVLGQGVANVGGRALRGVVNPAVERLRAAGIPLTAGEVLGGGWKKAQDAAASYLPGIGQRYSEGRRAMNLEGFNQAGAEVGTPINAVGQQGAQRLNTAKNQAYSEALDPVQLDLNDPAIVGDLRAAVTSAQNIPNVDQASDLATGALANYIGGAAPAGQMAGRDFQQAYRGLARTARTAAPRVYGHEIGQAMGQGQDALVGALQAQHPGAYQEFLNANSANRHLSILNEALNAAQNQVNDAGEQLFTPAQLGRAATNNARTYNGRVAAASGNRPFNQLTLDAQQVMSSKIPDSGTATRLAVGLGLTGAGGATGYATDNPVKGVVLPAAAMALLGTRRGQQILAATLLNRPQRFIRVGNTMVRNPQYGGDLATSLAVPAITSANQ